LHMGVIDTRMAGRWPVPGLPNHPMASGDHIHTSTHPYIHRPWPMSLVFFFYYSVTTPAHVSVLPRRWCWLSAGSSRRRSASILVRNCDQSVAPLAARSPPPLSSYRSNLHGVNPRPAFLRPSRLCLYSRPSTSLVLSSQMQVHVAASTSLTAPRTAVDGRKVAHSLAVVSLCM